MYNLAEQRMSRDNGTVRFDRCQLTERWIEHDIVYNVTDDLTIITIVKGYKKKKCVLNNIYRHLIQYTLDREFFISIKATPFLIFDGSNLNTLISWNCTLAIMVKL